MSSTITALTSGGGLAMAGDTSGQLEFKSDSTKLGLVGTGTNTAFGNQALNVNTGTTNTAVGYQAALANTTGSITAYGYQAGLANTTGTDTTALGFWAVKSNTTGTANVGVGGYALQNNTTGISNTALGYTSLQANTTGTSNVGLGYQALIQNTNASNNTAVGYQAGFGITTGDTVTALGKGSASTLTTGYAGTYLGAASTASGTNALYEMVICAGNGAIGKGNSTGFISPNGGGVYQGNNGATWAVTSDARLKKNIVDNNTGLDVINAIQVRNFEYRLPDEVTELEPTCAIKKTGVQLGVIAQEILEVSEEFVRTESTGVMSVNSDNLTWYLVNAVKELNAKVDAQALEIQALKGVA
jgi:hypothetical protein